MLPFTNQEVKDDHKPAVSEPLKNPIEPLIWKGIMGTYVRVVLYFGPPVRSLWQDTF